MRRTLVSLLLVTAVTLPGCVAVAPGHAHGYGPPPHAPANGYRSNHHGAELVFDRSLGAYAVVGYTDTYYVDGRFLRLRVSTWEESLELSGPWHGVPARSLPPGLARKGHFPHAAGFPGRGRGRGRGHDLPAKGHW